MVPLVLTLANWRLEGKGGVSEAHIGCHLPPSSSRPDPTARCVPESLTFLLAVPPYPACFNLELSTVLSQMSDFFKRELESNDEVITH